MLNANLWGHSCETDVQRCLDSHFMDHSFSQKIDAWHTVCDPSLSTSTLTTPAQPTITGTLDLGACDRLALSCQSGNYETNECSYTWLPRSSLSYVSCICQPPIYSLMSECQYNGNISCFHTTAHESNILGYPVCSFFWSGSVRTSRSCMI
jgi:hypothetical protein